MSNEFDRSQWLDKIEKILVKANRAASAEEAELFYTKAQELMVKWSIDEAMLQKAGKSHDELITEHVEMKRSGLFKTYVALWSAVAKANDVKILIYSPGDWRVPGVDLIGWKTDIDKVKMLYASFMIQSQRERNNSIPEYMKQGERWSNSAEVARWRKSFQVGYANRIGQRLREAKARTQTEVVSRSKTSSGMELAIRDRSAAVNDYYDSLPKGKARSSRMKLDYEAMGSGRQAADRADLGQTRMGGERGKLDR